MTTPLRIATFNLENLDDRAKTVPPLEERLGILRPQLERLSADVLCLQEVNAQPVGQHRTYRALDRLVEGTPYADFERATTTNDAGTKPRDVQNLVILSRFPITHSRQYINDLVPEPLARRITAEPPEDELHPIHWDRPILHATLDLEGAPLEVINLHLRAPLAAFVPGQKSGAFEWKTVEGWAEGGYLAAIKRAGQAFETRLLVDQLFDENRDARIVVCGDFNAGARELPLSAIRADLESTGNSALAYRTLVPLELSLPENLRFTVRHAGVGLMLDHILVSRALLAHFRSAEIHNELITDELIAYYSGRKDADSYHAPVIATFELS